MTHSVGKNDTAIRAALERAARALPGQFGAERLFLEARVDLRIETGWDGRHEQNINETSGVAFDGPHSLHVAGAGLDDLVPLLEGAAVAPGTRSNDPAGTGQLVIDEEAVEEWLRPKAAMMGTASPSAKQVEARALGRWTLTLIAFRQAVWVVHRDGVVEPDHREGSRLELRTWLSGHPNTVVTVDQVLTAQTPPREPPDFGTAFDRSTQKRGRCARAPIGPTAAVFATGVGGVVIHELVGHALEGDAPLHRPAWIHRASASTQRTVTVLDDPRRGRGAWRIDDEGVPAGATRLVDAGRPVGFLLDRASAAAHGKAPNGHGRRASYLAPVRPRMGCTWIEAGGDASGDAVRDTRSGVFVRRMSAGHTDPISGRASFIVSDADRIDSGAIAGPLEPFVLELDGPAAWASIDRLEADLTFDTCIGSCVRDGQPLAVSVGAPTMRIGVASIVC